MNIIKFKDINITYEDLDNYFKEMKDNRNNRDKILEEIAFYHHDILVKYSKNKPPIDDISLNTFNFKPLTDIKGDLCYSNLNSNINYSCNNTLFHLLNNIIIKKKEDELNSRIENLEFKLKIHSYMHISVIILILGYQLFI